jgi:MSHA pilin protein MshD
MNGPRQQGATLIELIVSVVIISIVATSAMMLVANTVGRSGDPLIRTQAIAIAEAYMEEMVALPISDPEGGDTGGIEVGEDPARRDLYDDITDYAVVNDSGAKNQYGAAVAGLESYGVEVTVADTTLNGSPAKRMLVEVTHAGDDAFVLSLVGYRLAQ